MSDKILVIEDNKKHREELAYLFRKEGFEVATAANIGEIRKQTQTDQINNYFLITMDIGIPEFDINQAIVETYSMGGYNGAIIVISAFFEKDDVTTYNSREIHRFKKPINTEALISKIKALCSNNANTTPPAPTLQHSESNVS